MHQIRRLGAARPATLRRQLPRLAAAGLGLCALSCGSDPRGISAAWVQALPAVEAEEAIETGPPPFSEDIFPCSECHDPEFPVNTTRRELKMAHQDIVLDHSEESRWCLDCHSSEDRDRLHLANGELVPFEESYRLCGQCHGDKYRDWRAGVHGRRSGEWHGHKSYLLCVNCHNAHHPAFAPLEPEPAPNKPERTR